MNGWSVNQLDELTHVMYPVAADMVCQVHDRADATVRRILTRMDPVHLRALVVVLAAMVPDDVPMDDLVAWTRATPHELLEQVSPVHAARNRAALAAAVGAEDDYRPSPKEAAA